mmetsp:Transcript_33044/g.71332  ORF Transcript_33044/g.71332 Transcript_33044/m.71332 type:complete len:191 (+) Transcript_33044:1156-1728(+)
MVEEINNIDERLKKIENTDCEEKSGMDMVIERMEHLEESKDEICEESEYEFVTGDWVLLKREKSENRSEGPYKISSIINSIAGIEMNGEVKKIHVSYLQKYKFPMNVEERKIEAEEKSLTKEGIGDRDKKCVENDVHEFEEEEETESVEANRNNGMTRRTYKDGDAERDRLSSLLETNTSEREILRSIAI